ncbi:phosphoserine aminotransferase [Blattabacterium cuenoti]|uniref:phosphoserine aminotransferase n=1 Tax=Blattabacterium cuenoti TaxID=1653831 RepID=UPI00163D2B6B|nr:phosphoserine aminotransferase [Blattabacterium cuenoti]
MIKTFDKIGKILREFRKFYINKKLNNSFFSNNEIKKFFPSIKKIIQRISINNSWFHMEDLLLSIDQWGKTLTRKNLEYWIDKQFYKINNNKNKEKNVLVIMPGNIPLAGFHDFLCVIISGYKIIIKLSQKDNLLFPFLCKIMKHINPMLKDKIKFTENFFKEKYDYVIATGNNNTARYFEYYFREKPLLLRNNRTSIAILQGDEKQEDLIFLNKDILTYSGRGCRNIGKIFIPYKYNISHILDKSYLYKYITRNKKYMDNYKYYLSIYNMNKKICIKNNDFLIFKEDKNYFSPISVVYYEYYKNLDKLRKNIIKNKKHLQCIVAKNFLEEEICFGEAQLPKLEDYADGINTIQFLSRKIK